MLLMGHFLLCLYFFPHVAARLPAVFAMLEQVSDRKMAGLFVRDCDEVSTNSTMREGKRTNLFTLCAGRAADLVYRPVHEFSLLLAS